MNTNVQLISCVAIKISHNELKACFNPLPFKIWRGELKQLENKNRETSQMDVIYQMDDIFVHDENTKYVYNAT